VLHSCEHSSPNFSVVCSPFRDFPRKGDRASRRLDQLLIFSHSNVYALSWSNLSEEKWGGVQSVPKYRYSVKSMRRLDGSLMDYSYLTSTRKGFKANINWTWSSRCNSNGSGVTQYARELESVYEAKDTYSYFTKGSLKLPSRVCYAIDSRPSILVNFWLINGSRVVSFASFLQDLRMLKTTWTRLLLLGLLLIETSSARK